MHYCAPMDALLHNYNPQRRTEEGIRIVACGGMTREETLGKHNLFENSGMTTNTLYANLKS